MDVNVKLIHDVKRLHGEFSGWQCETTPCDGHIMAMINSSM
jgi:hypothetical protein